MVVANASVLKEENKVKDVSGLACYAGKNSNTKAFYLHDNICYAFSLSAIAVNSRPSDPVNCHMKTHVFLPNEGKVSNLSKES